MEAPDKVCAQRAWKVPQEIEFIPVRDVVALRLGGEKSSSDEKTKEPT
jgi:hypothetical protein